MTRSSLKALAFVVPFLCLCSTGFCQSSSPQGVADLFVKAWNAHDMKGFERLFTHDAIWVPVAEAMDKGRAGIVKDLSEAHKTWARTTQMKRDSVTVLRVTRDIATLFFHAHFVVDGKVAQGIDRAMIMVVKKNSGKWFLTAGQLTKQHDGA